MGPGWGCWCPPGWRTCTHLCALLPGRLSAGRRAARGQKAPPLGPEGIAALTEMQKMYMRLSKLHQAMKDQLQRAQVGAPLHPPTPGPAPEVPKGEGVRGPVVPMLPF